jgi:hypothetical protein
MPQSEEEILFQVPPPAKYDGVIREASYLLRHLLRAWEVSLGVDVPRTASEEDKTRWELGEINVSLTHARNVIRALSARRDVLSDALVIVERPRVDAAQRDAAPRAVEQADGYEDGV